MESIVLVAWLPFFWLFFAALAYFGSSWSGWVLSWRDSMRFAFVYLISAFIAGYLGGIIRPASGTFAGAIWATCLVLITISPPIWYLQGRLLQKAGAAASLPARVSLTVGLSLVTGVVLFAILALLAGAFRP